MKKKHDVQKLGLGTVIYQSQSKNVGYLTVLIHFKTGSTFLCLPNKTHNQEANTLSGMKFCFAD